MPAVAEDQAGAYDPLFWDHLPGVCGAPYHQSAAAALQQSAPHAGACRPGVSPPPLPELAAMQCEQFWVWQSSNLIVSSRGGVVLTSRDVLTMQGLVRHNTMPLIDTAKISTML